jgi:restriction endonuclease S subunit
LEGLEVNEKNCSELKEYILGSNFNSIRKTKALNKINSQEKVIDYFDFHSDIIKNSFNVLNYDLTHTLDNFIHEVEISEHIEGMRKLAKHGDFIISRLRSYLKEFAVVQKRKEKQVFSTEYLVYRPKTNLISSNTLLVFCLTDEVQTILNCSQYGTEHPRFYECVFNELPLPKILFDLNDKINEIFEKCFHLRDQSQSLYRQAEKLLLETIGLKDFQPSQENINIKSFSESFLTTGRLDVEYYQPKYDLIEKRFDEFERIALSNLVSYPISSGVTPKAGGNDYTDEKDGIPFIRAVDMINGEVSTNNFNYIKSNVHNGILKRTQLKKYDVLFSIAGTVGRCAIFNHGFEANINQAVSILRFEETKVLRLYLVVFFNSYIGKEFVSKYARQGLQTNLNLEEVGALGVPVIDYSIQRQIAELIEKSFYLRGESKRLLDEAKGMVEKELEKN